MHIPLFMTITFLRRSLPAYVRNRVRHLILKEKKQFICTMWQAHVTSPYQYLVSYRLLACNVGGQVLESSPIVAAYFQK